MRPLAIAHEAALWSIEIAIIIGATVIHPWLGGFAAATMLAWLHHVYTRPRE